MRITGCARRRRRKAFRNLMAEIAAAAEFLRRERMILTASMCLKGSWPSCADAAPGWRPFCCLKVCACVWLIDLPPDLQQMLRIAGLVLTVPVIAYLAVPCFAGACRGLLRFHLGVDLTIAAGIAVAFAGQDDSAGRVQSRRCG